MGLGKTITCVSLIAATLDSAIAFASSPLQLPVHPDRNQHEDTLSADHFAGSIWGMPDTSESSSSTKGKAKATKEQDKAEADYTRACRIKTKSRATLIICPLSTVSNWEDQFREHWRGDVVIVGGGGISCSAATSTPPATSTSTSPASQTFSAHLVTNTGTNLHRKRDGRPLRVYVYHGNSRRPDVAFLADFDAVITTYATLASEYSKQNRSIISSEADDEDDGSSDGGIGSGEAEANVIRLSKLKRVGMKRKKSCFALCGSTEATSPLQMINWFRVVLDEAQYVFGRSS